jgi:hypothetical protein
VSLVAMALAGTVSRRASADEARTSSLSWLRMPGTEACVATQALARSVEERLGRRVFVSAAESDVSVEGRIERRAGAAGGWHAVITVRDGKGARLGTRELDRAGTDACDTMSEPLALVIAVMIDPDAKLGARPAPPAPLPPAAPAPPDTAPPAPLPPAAPAPPAALPPAPEAATPQPPRRDGPWRFEGDAYASLLTGVAPKLDPGAGVAGILFVPGLPLGVRGSANLYLPTTAEQDGARASFDLFYLGGALCPTLRRPAVTLMLCLGGHLGVLRSHPETAGRVIDEKTAILWNAVTEGRVSLPVIAPVALTAGVSAVLPLVRPTFEYTSSDRAVGRANLHEVSAFALAADAGIGFFFQ